MRWPGSTHDSTIWQLSGVKSTIEDYVKRKGANYKGWLLGDSGYAQREIMMVPLLDADCELTAQEKRYNEAHKKCRCTVERAIGVLKSRFRCLCRNTGGGIQYKESTACNIIVSCFVLHNYCRSRNIDYDIDPDVAEMMRQESLVAINRKHLEKLNLKDVVALKLGQIARAAVIESF